MTVVGTPPPPPPAAPAPPTDPTKVRFYVDRLALTNPASPQLSSTNTPGTLLSLNAAGTRALTVTYKKVVEQTDHQTCSDKWGFGHFVEGSAELGTCTGHLRGLSMVTLGGAVASVLDTRALDPSQHPFRVALGTDRVWMGSYSNSGAMGLVVLSGLSAGKIQTSIVESPENEHGGISDLIGDGTRAVAMRTNPRRVAVIDATDPTAPTHTTVAKLGRGQGFYDNPSTVIGDTLVVPRGPYGVDLVDLTPSSPTARRSAYWNASGSFSREARAPSGISIVI